MPFCKQTKLRQRHSGHARAMLAGNGGGAKRDPTGPWIIGQLARLPRMRRANGLMHGPTPATTSQLVLDRARSRVSSGRMHAGCLHMNQGMNQEAISLAWCNLSALRASDYVIGLFDGPVSSVRIRESLGNHFPDIIDPDASCLMTA